MHWCASFLTTCVLPMTPSACPLKSSVMEQMIVPMALTRSFVVCIEYLQCLFHLLVNDMQQYCFIHIVCFFSVDLCAVDKGGCSHNCSIIPGEGFMCSCPLGMELGPDNKTCQIQSFCAKHLKCSQKCEQEKSTVKCSCYEGWELESDMESCKSTGEEY